MSAINCKPLRGARVAGAFSSLEFTRRNMGRVLWRRNPGGFAHSISNAAIAFITRSLRR